MTFHSPQFIAPLWGLSELCLALLKRSKPEADSKDGRSIGIIWLVTLVSVALGFFAFYRLPMGRLPWPGLMTGSSLCLLVVGLTLRWLSIHHLGRFFTVNVAIARDHEVVDSGPYRFIRHPSYTGNLLAVLGLALSFQNWVSLLVIFVPCCAVMLHRIRLEEAALLEALGERYRRYMQRTKRLIPAVY